MGSGSCRRCTGLLRPAGTDRTASGARLALPGAGARRTSSPRARGADRTSGSSRSRAARPARPLDPSGGRSTRNSCPGTWGTPGPARPHVPAPGAPCRAPAQGCTTCGTRASRCRLPQQERESLAEASAPRRLVVHAVLVLHPAKVAPPLVALREEQVAQPASERHGLLALAHPDVEVQPARHPGRPCHEVEEGAIGEPEGGTERSREAEALGVPEEGIQAGPPAHGGPCDPGVTAIGQGGELRVHDRP